MTERCTIGLIGFGEVGQTFGKAIVEHGARVLAYDVAVSQLEHGGALQERARECGVQLVSIEEVTGAADLILSLVTTQVARAVAERCAPLLKGGSIYIDANSTSPPTKLEIQSIIEAQGGCFVEAAILGAVGATGAQTRALLAGESAEYAAETLCGLGLAFEAFSEQVGRASTFKMLRSVFSKGLEVILIEMLIAGEKVGIADELWNDITAFMDAKAFGTIAANWITSHAVAHERRYHEMQQVRETLLSLSVDPLLTQATESFFERSGTLGLEHLFDEKPSEWKAVVVAMMQALEGGRETSDG